MLILPLFLLCLGSNIFYGSIKPSKYFNKANSGFESLTSES